VQDQFVPMKKEERVDRLDECYQAKMNVLTGFAYRRWIMPSTQLLLDGVLFKPNFINSNY